MLGRIYLMYLQGQVRIGITDFSGLVILSDSSQHEACSKKVLFLWYLSTNKFRIIYKIATVLSGDAVSFILLLCLMWQLLVWRCAEIQRISFALART